MDIKFTLNVDLIKLNCAIELIGFNSEFQNWQAAPEWTSRNTTQSLSACGNRGALQN